MEYRKYVETYYIKSVLLVNGSPHGNGNTKTALTIAEKCLRKEDRHWHRV